MRDTCWVAMGTRWRGRRTWTVWRRRGAVRVALLQFAGVHAVAPVDSDRAVAALGGRHGAVPPPLAEDKPTLAKHSDGGVRDRCFGKMHFNRPAEPGLHGFDVAMTEDEITKAWMRDVKPRPFPENIRGETGAVASVPGPGSHLAECRQAAAGAIRRGGARDVHRAAGDCSSGGESKTVRAVGQFSGASFAVRFSGRGPGAVRRGEFHGSASGAGRRVADFRRFFGN